MRVAPCSNCGSSDLRVTPTDAVGLFGPDLLPGASGVFDRAKIDIVVCCSCGCTRFFAPREAVDKLAKLLWFLGLVAILTGQALIAHVCPMPKTR